MLRVLVVDDDETTRDTYGLILRRDGYTVDVADSGTSAIQSLSTGELPRGMFLDLRLGDMSGFDVLRWMRSEHRFIPTVVMTAFRLDVDPDQALDLGALAYVDQPLSVDDILPLARSLTKPPSSQDDPNDLHARVIAGDPGALDSLEAILLSVLPGRLQRSFPRAPADFAEDAASSACLEYAGSSARRIDRIRGCSVVDFVYIIAWRNLRDRLRSESFRRNRERRWAKERPVAEEPEWTVPERTLDIRAVVREVTNDPREYRATDVLLDGAAVDDIATALGCGQLDATGRRRVVNQFRARMIRRLSRYVRRENLRG